MENDNLHDSGAADSDRSIEDIERELIGMISAAAGSDLIAVPELVQGSSLDTNRDTTMGSNPDVITDAAPGAAPDVARGVDEHGLPEEPWVDRLERASEQLDETPGPGSSLNPTSRASTVPPTEYQDAQEKPDNHVPVTDAVPFEHGNLLHPSTADTTSTNTILQSIEVELLSLINRVERSRDEASPENDAISPGPKKPILQ